MKNTQRRIAVLTLALGALAACTHEKPNFIYMPDMVYSPAIKAQSEGSMRSPVKGTVPRDFEIYPHPHEAKAEEVGKEFHNPLKATKSVLARGQALFNVYCIVCHGPAGEGDGSIVPKFPRPPSLQSDKVRAWIDGNIFHVVSAGQNLMPSYASQISPQDRWAIIHYVRALQRSKHPTPDDLKKAEAQAKND
jgi:mono/diheme cytochrome c family protein